MAKFQTIKLRSGEEIRLSEREIMFCEYYLGDSNRNATQAAIKAGYSERSANSTAPEILAKSSVQKYLANKTAPILEALGITQERILKRLADIAFADLKDLVNEDWDLKSPEEIDERHHGALAQVEVETVSIQEGAGTVTKKRFKLKQSEKALLTLAEISGLINRRQEAPQQTTQVNIYQQINGELKG